MSTCQSLNYSSSSPYNSYIRTILEIAIATTNTTAIAYTTSMEVEMAGGMYNRAVRGYCNRRLLNGKRCLKRILWYWNGWSIWFERKTYYYKQKNRDGFAFHHEHLVTNCWFVFPHFQFYVCGLNSSLQWWLISLAAYWNDAYHAYGEL